jgi:hypothetical protein
MRDMPSAGDAGGGQANRSGATAQQRAQGGIRESRKSQFRKFRPVATNNAQRASTKALILLGKSRVAALEYHRQVTHMRSGGRRQQPSPF